MPDLHFEIERAAPVRYAQTPMLVFMLKLSNVVPQEQIQSIMLQYQVWIEPAGRRYVEQEHSLLLDLFGEPGSVEPHGAQSPVDERHRPGSCIFGQSGCRPRRTLHL